MLWGRGPAMFVVLGMSTTDTASGLGPLISGVCVFTRSAAPHIYMAHAYII